jgi:hypothetical protein
VNIHCEEKLPKPGISLLFEDLNCFVVYAITLSPRGAVVKAAVQRSDDLCVASSNPTVGRGCQSFG